MLIRNRWFFSFSPRSVRERRRAQTASATGAEQIGHVAGDDQQRSAGQREFQRERTPDADWSQGQAVERPVQPFPQEKGHQPVKPQTIMIII